MQSYQVILFKNKKAKKILKKFVTFKNAKNYFEKLCKTSSEILFEVRFESGKSCDYEIAIVENSSQQLVPVYLTDELGRNVKVKLNDEGMTIVEIKKYKKEERIFDISESRKISLNYFITYYLRGTGLKMISGLNNKIIVQNDENLNLFSMKNTEEVSRLLSTLTDYFIKIGKKDCLIVKDDSLAQKKYLIDLLEKYQIDKKILYRKFTTHPSK